MDIGSVVDSIIYALDNSSTPDRDRWMLLNRSAHAMISARSQKDYVTAQESFEQSQQRPLGPEVSLFPGAFPTGPLDEQYADAIRAALSSARARYHARRRAQQLHLGF